MGKPVWRRVFDRVERAVGEPLEDAVASRDYIKVVVLGIKGPLAVNRGLRREIDRQIGAVLHSLNLPTHDDIVRLARQLSVLTAEVRGLSLPADQIATYVEQVRERDKAIDSRPPNGNIVNAPTAERETVKEGEGGT
jgi:hypothetical protein